MNKFGELVTCFVLDNDGKLRFGYSTDCTIHDIVFEDFDGEPWFSIPKYPLKPELRAAGLKGRVYYPVAGVQAVIIRDAGSGDLLFDRLEM